MKQVVIPSVVKTVLKAISISALFLFVAVSAFAQCNAQFTCVTDTSDNAKFTAPQNPPGTKYYWNFGDGSPYSNDQDPSHTYAQPGVYWVCLYVSDSFPACSNQFCDSVHVGRNALVKPVCNAHYEHYSAANPDSIHFYQYNTGSTYKFSWAFGDGTYSSNPTPWHFYADSGIYTVCLTVTDSTPGGTCSDYFCDTVHIPGFPAPVCNAHFQFYSLSNPDSVHFYAATTSSPSIKYSWSFGDGSGSDLPSPWHFYPNYGKYTVCLTVTDSTPGGKCEDHWCDTVNVGINVIPCNAQFTSRFDTTGALYSESFFSNPNPAGTKYYWSFGDNTTSTNPNPTHIYIQPGAYYVCLYVTDSSICSQSWCDSVHVRAKINTTCNAQFVHYPATDNVDSVHFYPTGNNAANATYYWSFGDGSSSDAFNPWHIYAPGNYQACLTVTDSGGTCTNTWCDSVHVPGRPVCNAQFQFYSINTNSDSVHFYTSPTNTSTTKYLWTFGDGSYSDSPYPWHFYANAGTYYVCLTVSDSTQAGKCSDTWCDSVHVGHVIQPVCNATFYHYSAGSNPDSVHFYTSATSATIKYSWDFGDGGTSHNADPWHLFAPGSYQVCLTVTDSTQGGTCTSTWCDSIHIVGPRAPICDAHFKYYTIHNPDSLHFYPTNTGADATTKYLWDFGDGTTSDGQYPWHLYTDTGTYTVCLTVIDSTSGGKCHDTWCDTVHISPLPPPQCNAHFSHISANSLNTEIHFVPAQNGQGTTYSWSFGDGSYSTNVDPTHTYANYGTYWVCLSVRDSTNSGVCENTWCDSVHVGPTRIPCNAEFSFQFAYNVNTLYFVHAPNAPGTRYSWNFGDDSTSSVPNPLHQFANPGTYWVCLTVDDSLGACSQTWCDSVHVMGFYPSICNANFYFKPGNVAHSLYFLSAPNTPSTLYSWDFGDNSTSTQPNPFHQYAAAGTYKVCLTVTDTIALCSDTRCLTIGPLRMASGGSTLDAQNSGIATSVYPNPITESATLHIENTNGAVVFKMYDNLGRLATTMSNLTNGDFILSKQGLGAGIYIYEVIDADNNVSRGKLIIQ